MTLYAGGQQPFQRTSTEANTLSAKFTVTTAAEDAHAKLQKDSDTETVNKEQNVKEDQERKRNEHEIMTEEKEQKDDRLLFSSRYYKGMKTAITP